MPKQECGSLAATGCTAMQPMCVVVQQITCLQCVEWAEALGHQPISDSV